MSIVVPPGFASAAWVFTGPYGTGPFVFTIGLDASDAGGDFVGMANACRTSFTSNFTTLLSNGITLSKVSVTVGQDGDGDYSVDSDLAPVTGSRDGSNDPIALSLLVNKNTARPGRQGRGRFNVPGVLAGTQTGLGGDLTPSAVTEFTTAVEAFEADLRSGVDTLYPACPPVLLHSDADAPTPISSFTLNSKVGVLRKRLR